MFSREEFLFDFGNHKLYSIRDLDYFDDILIAENQEFWDRVAAGWAIVFTQENKKYRKEPELIPVARMRITDIVKKYG